MVLTRWQVPSALARETCTRSAVETMELKVWVEGIQRIVCGVTEKTTCQDVVYALAHATGKTGRFTLIERWRSNERLLAPNENPLKVLMKWGEYSNDVQFILQHSPLDGRTGQSPLQKTRPPDLHPNHHSTHSVPDTKPPSNNQPKDLKKSLTFSGGHHSNSPYQQKRDNVGVVKGVPQRPPDKPESPSLKKDTDCQVKVTSQGCNNNRGVRDPPPYREPPRPTSPPSSTPDKKERKLPPYRAPPPPNQAHHSSSPLHRTGGCASPPSSSTASSPALPATPSQGAQHIQESPVSSSARGSGEKQEGWSKSPKPRRNLLKEFRSAGSGGDSDSLSSSSVQSPPSTAPPPPDQQFEAQRRELIKLIKHQQSKLSTQQSELVKYDAEIMYLESKSGEQEQKLEYIRKEMGQLELTSRQQEDRARVLTHLEDEQDITRQQEKTLKSEITLLRSKVANCETELLQCKNKIRLLLDEIQLDQRQLSCEEEDRRQREMNLLNELEQIGREVEQAKRSSDVSCQGLNKLDREVAALEVSIAHKREQVEQLVQQMKEANLQSLSIAPAEELRFLIEGPHKSGSARKMIGSPRQLENAVPTSKNPHGVWV